MANSSIRKFFQWVALGLVWLQASEAYGHRIDHLSITAETDRAGQQWQVETSIEAKVVLEAQRKLSALPRLWQDGPVREAALEEISEYAQEYVSGLAYFQAGEEKIAWPRLSWSLVTVLESEATDNPANVAEDKKHLFLVGRANALARPAALTGRPFQLTVNGALPVRYTRKIAGEVYGPVVPYFTGMTSKPWEWPTAEKPAVGEISAVPAAAEPPEPWWRVLGRFIHQGFIHIIPEGLDHILFVLGLFFLGRHWKPLLWQVTLFTLAHSVTLALAMLDIVRLPDRPVEVAIAASIAFVAIENIFRSSMSRWRPAVVFIFGLIHGLGFAGAFKEVGVDQSSFITSLVGFNLGVELGQLAVIGLAFLAVGWFRQREWYKPRICVPASIVIALFGLYWAVQRSLE
jgi:hypothetical protein